MKNKDMSKQTEKMIKVVFKVKTHINWVTYEAGETIKVSLEIYEQIKSFIC